MAQKPLLHQLLQEDQEPFLLKNYIADRRCQIKKATSTPRTNFQIKKINKPISQNFCKNACFFSVNNSPDVRKSPLFEFQSPVKSPCKSSNAIFLHIPAKTSALLLEAALRIQRQSSSSTPKSKNNNGFGLFGSLIKRLTHRNQTRKLEINGDGVKTRKLAANNQRETEQEQRIFMVNVNKKSAYEINGFCNGRPSSAVWSESNEEKSWDLDLETSCSSQSEEEEEEYCTGNFEFLHGNTTDFASFDNHFCESPFHFVLRRSPSSGHRTPVFSSPVASPIRHKTEGKEKIEIESLKKYKEKEEAEEEEDKEQSSPVSVLDPPFQDDVDGHDDQSEDDDGFDLNCSYAIVQRAKQQLLKKLRRFEKLAELDPVELEKRMFEEEQEFDDDAHQDLEDEVEFEDEDELVLCDLIIEELISKSNFSIFPRDMKRLVSDLINEEKKEEEEEEDKYFTDRETMVKRVCKRFESWQEVESNTIDMMVEQDFKKEVDLWRRNQEQVRETALEIEIGIFGLLMQELSEELLVNFESFSNVV